MIRVVLLTAAMAIGVIVAGGCEGEAPREATRRGGGPSRATAPSLTTTEFDVKGMTCGGCAIATELAVRRLHGVTSVDAVYDAESGAGRCSVVYDSAVVSTEEIAEAIRDAGFEPLLRSGEG